MERLECAILDNEYWWGGVVNAGYRMPLGRDSVGLFSPYTGRENDQFAPFYVSSAGRYIRSERPFVLSAEGGVIRCEGPGRITLHEGCGDLKGAYLEASGKYFPFTGTIPDEMFFTSPQYNTWIELGSKDNTEEGVLRYARGIIGHGLPAGVFMIDGGWNEDNGVFEFNYRKFPHPKEMIAELHAMGFKVMLWTSPIVGSAGWQYKWLRDRGYLVRAADGEIAVRKWWSGFSAVLDLTNPGAVAWYHAQLDGLMERCGADGFKFDAGDIYFYADDDRIFRPTTAREATRSFNEAGEKYPLNEFRAAWDFGGRPIAARLHDKYPTWDGFGLNTLIPHTLVQGLLGYAYCCPDMVGGGIFDAFGDGRPVDQELFVRWAQASAYMGMMQMSMAPWRVLSEENAALVLDALKTHAAMGREFLRLARHASVTGEPIVRHMAYEFPGEGLERVQTQFMLGPDLLVAPVLEKGAADKEVFLPRGTWKAWNGTVYAGGRTVRVPVSLKDIPTFSIERRAMTRS